MKNGSPIQRLQNETIVKAIVRQTQNQSNFITVNHASIHASYNSDTELSEEEADYDSDLEYERRVYTATRAAKRTATNRQEKMEGVIGTAKKEIARKRGKAKDGTGEEIPTKPERAIPKSVPYKPRPVEVSIPIQTPIDVFRTPVIQTSDQDVVMEDSAIQQQLIPTPVKEGAKSDKERQAPEKRQPRRSEMQANVDPIGVLNKVLQTPVTLQVGEVFGISREITHHLQDAMRPKKPLAAHVQEENYSDQMTVASFFTRSRGTLIRLRMECDGIPITAIVDTGSQLNIAHKQTWKSILSRPMDLTKSIVMNDANGGEGVLQGFVPNVPLTCGNVLTHANIFIGDKAPFDLLLGRPWQRGNFVTIDERIDGTYLMFKDQNLDARYEILVTPDSSLARHETEIIEYLSKTQAHQASNDQIGIYFAEVSHEAPFREYDSESDSSIPELINIEDTYSDIDWDELDPSDSDSEDEYMEDDEEPITRAPDIWQMIEESLKKIAISAPRDQSPERMDTDPPSAGRLQERMTQDLASQPEKTELSTPQQQVTPPEHADTPPNAVTSPPEPETTDIAPLHMNSAPHHMHDALHQTDETPLHSVLTPPRLSGMPQQADMTPPRYKIREINDMRQTSDQASRPKKSLPQAKLRHAAPSLAFHNLEATPPIITGIQAFGANANRQTAAPAPDTDGDIEMTPIETLYKEGYANYRPTYHERAQIELIVPPNTPEPPVKRIRRTAKSAPPQLPSTSIFLATVPEEGLEDGEMSDMEIDPPAVIVSAPQPAIGESQISDTLEGPEFPRSSTRIYPAIRNIPANTPQLTSNEGRLADTLNAMDFPYHAIRRIPAMRDIQRQYRAWAPELIRTEIHSPAAAAERQNAIVQDYYNHAANEEERATEAYEALACPVLRTIPAMRETNWQYRSLARAVAARNGGTVRDYYTCPRHRTEDSAGPNIPNPETLPPRPEVAPIAQTAPTVQAAPSAQISEKEQEEIYINIEKRMEDLLREPDEDMSSFEDPPKSDTPWTGPRAVVPDRNGNIPIDEALQRQARAIRALQKEQSEREQDKISSAKGKAKEQAIIETYMALVGEAPEEQRDELLMQAINGLLSIGRQVNRLAEDITTDAPEQTPYPTPPHTPYSMSESERRGMPAPENHGHHAHAVRDLRRRNLRPNVEDQLVSSRGISRTERTRLRRSARERAHQTGPANRTESYADPFPSNGERDRLRRIEISRYERKNREQPDAPIRAHNRARGSQRPTEPRYSYEDRTRNKENQRGVRHVQSKKRTSTPSNIDRERLKPLDNTPDAYQAVERLGGRNRRYPPWSNDIYSATVARSATKAEKPEQMKDNDSPRATDCAPDTGDIEYREKGESENHTDGATGTTTESERTQESEDETYLETATDSTSEIELQLDELTQELEKINPYKSGQILAGTIPGAFSSRSPFPEMNENAHNVPVALAFRDHPVPLAHSASEWDPDLLDRPAFGNTPFDEREVRAADRSINSGSNTSPCRTIQISTHQALHLRNQHTLDGERVIRVLLKNAILTSLDPFNQSTLSHTLVQGFLYLLEEPDQSDTLSLTTLEPIPTTFDPATTTERPRKRVRAEGKAKGDQPDSEEKDKPRQVKTTKKLKFYVPTEQDIELEHEIFGADSDLSTISDEDRPEEQEPDPKGKAREQATRETETSELGPKADALSTAAQPDQTPESGIKASAATEADTHSQTDQIAKGDRPSSSSLTEVCTFERAATTTVPARTLPELTAGNAGINSELLQDALQRLDTFLSQRELALIGHGLDMDTDSDDGYSLIAHPNHSRPISVFTITSRKKDDDPHDSDVDSITDSYDADGEDDPDAIKVDDPQPAPVLSPHAIRAAIQLGTHVITSARDTPETEPKKIPGDFLREELAEEFRKLQAPGLRDNHPFRIGDRPVSPPTSNSHLRLRVPEQRPSPFQDPSHFYPFEDLASVNRITAALHPDARTAAEHRVQEEKERQEGRVHPNVSPVATALDADIRATFNRGDPAQTVILPELLETVPHHPPNGRYNAIYSVPIPQSLTLQHVQIRHCFVSVYRHVTLQARIMSFDPWLEGFHNQLHRDDTPINRDLHEKLFVPTSEWAGNPFLFALEEQTLRQCYEFYQSSAQVRGYDVRTMLGMIDSLLAIRLDGPDASIIVQQRLIGMYGRIGEIPPA
ncbi:hypothetical protein EIP86_002248 [Pleurotus ostreatoroseus]|nr:hypothetical protein EIP86_002248 [Pleurotus ostreatoroseus]